ncbi:MAG: FAD-dependent oxidoreductase [Candidatus Bathyarchaeota archaeon]|nr:MAG: FAD-dependent oxidoreductase [Candidatus Bathyarchaeota archaeon]
MSDKMSRFPQGGPQTVRILKELSKRSLDAKKLAYCDECGACTGSCPVVRIFPRHFNPRVFFNKLFLEFANVSTETDLWLCMMCYRCHSRCPHGLKLPEIFLSLREMVIEQGYLQDVPSKLQEILEILREEIPLSLVYTWLCLRPGEEEPKRDKFDTAILDALQRHIMDYKRKEVAPSPKTTKDKIAIIGSGPAGLTAAWELVRRGFIVTVFEALSEPGGMLRVGIPEYRLPKEVLDAEIEHIKDLGVEIRTNTAIGKALLFNDLLGEERYTAIFIATGAHRSRKLRIEGEDMEGVVHALGLLRQVNLHKQPRLGEKVGIVGGGNTAMDAARTAQRLGAKKVNILYRRSREEMPANPLEVEEAERSGVEIHFLLTPRKILGKNKQVVGAECIRMKLGSPDESGRRRPIPIEGSEFTIELDTAIIAIGESPDTSFLPNEIKVTEWNTIEVDPITLETSLPGVFAGGDVVSGPASVVEAIDAGKRAAISINRYLNGARVKFP